MDGPKHMRSWRRRQEILKVLLTLLDAMQLVIGGRNKYLINGHVAQPT